MYNLSMTRFSDDPGEVDLNGGASSLWVPASVDLSADKRRLVWSLSTETKHSQFVAADPDVLSQFAELARANTPVEVIRDFARRYGILRICKHGLPATHSDSPNNSIYFGEERDFSRYPYCRPLGTSFGNENEGFEPVDRWRFFSRQARAILNVMAQFNLDELGLEEDWKTILEHANSDPGRDLGQQRLDCVAVVNTWLRVASVIPQIHYDYNPFNHRLKHPALEAAPKTREGYRVEFETDLFFRGSRLFAYLACQLMTAAVGRGVGLCSGCGKIYTPPKRKPKRGQNNYCTKCGRAAATRDASARLRANPEYQRRQKLKKLRTTKKAKKR